MTNVVSRTDGSARWQGLQSEVARAVLGRREKTLRVYSDDPARVDEDYGIEQNVLSGGYGHRQIYELVQNAADAIQISPKGKGKVHVLLTESSLYCANEGEPVDPEGVTSLLMSHLSSKRGAQIGHFGLGFKSVLAVTDCPQFYSTSGSFEFNALKSATIIRGMAPAAAHTPILRIAFPIDPADAAKADSCLAELMLWATTVVKLPRQAGCAMWLSDDLQAFPATFLLFSPHVEELILEDRTRDAVRTISSSKADHMVTIREGDSTSSWAVFSADIETGALPTDARADADPKIIDRPTLPLLWAVQTAGARGRSRGSFWAFFPTETEMTLSGILNAPWKTNSDRQNLLEGPLNRSLLDRAIDLVAEKITRLLDPKDPGKLLDLLPAREDTGWADRHLAEHLFEKLSLTPCMPDVNASCHIPALLKLRPPIVLESTVSEWLSSRETPEVPDDWCHHTVEKRDRRYRAERLGSSTAHVKDWMEAVAKPATVRASLTAIALAEAVLKEMPSYQKNDVLSAAFVLGADGHLHTPSSGVLFIASPEMPGDAPNVVYVHSEIAASPEALRILTDCLGLKRMSPVAQLEAILDAIRRTPYHQEPRVEWERLWILSRQIDKAVAVGLLGHDSVRHVLRAKTVDGKFRGLKGVLLPGAIVPPDGTRDSQVAVDIAFHKEDADILRLLGLVDVPGSGRDESKAEWFADYRQFAQHDFCKRLPPGSSHPQSGYLIFNSTETTGPLDPIMSLSDEGRALFVEHLLPFAATEKGWVMRHSTRPDQYPSIPISPAPLAWLICKHGRLRSTLGVVPVSDAVDEALSPWGEVLPVVQNPTSADLSLLNLPSDLASLGEQHWRAGFLAAQHSGNDKLICAFYSQAAILQQPQPDTIRCLKGSGHVLLPPSEVYVASDIGAFSVHAKADMPCIMAPSRQDAETLVTRWGLKQGINSTLRFLSEVADYPLLDEFPGLRNHLAPEQQAHRLQPCSELWVEASDPAVGLKRHDLDFVQSEETVYFRRAIPNDDLLKRIIGALNLRLSDAEIQQVLQYLDRQDRRKRLEAIQQLSDLAEKLLLALGEPSLRAGLPASLITSAFPEGAPIPSLCLAQMALAAYGIDTLRRYGPDLDLADWDPPRQWAGSQRAQQFVTELGFPLAYAGFQSSKRPPYLEVDGPIDLKPLHDFQEKISARILDFLRLSLPSRGLLSLPTGAGKTRVVVQSLVRAISEGRAGGVMLWVAQTDELCEQAVQAWSEVWRALGPKRTLRISRFWGETNDFVGPASDQTHLVVSTYQTLIRRMGQPEYAWLMKPTCVIIDEAHGAVAPSYTQILAALGLTSKETARPLIGLTATPFRGGQDEGETLWLVHRFDSTRFDQDIFPQEPYAELQRMGILAHVDHQRLDGVLIALTDRELEELRRFSVLPPSAEQKLGEDAKRNRILLSSISALPAEWPVLLFATSVDHAHLMAALLTLEGIPAQAISSETDSRTRRYYVEEFKKGRLRVLTNYNVLTAGFDAPAVRALYIARPVYSRGLYQQMIGRGLRGPKNGGKERCFIVNVEDNVQQYGEQLAFRHFEHLWNRS